MYISLFKKVAPERLVLKNEFKKEGRGKIHLLASFIKILVEEKMKHLTWENKNKFSQTLLYATFYSRAEILYVKSWVVWHLEVAWGK